MSRQIVLLPSSLDYLEVLKFSLDIIDIDDADEYIFDVSAVQKVRPFGMLMCSALLKQFIANKRKCSLGSAPRFKISNFDQNVPAHGYAAHVGFFRSWGAPFGYAPGEASGSSTYKPIKELSAENIQAKSIELMIPYGEVIELASKDFAAFLGQWQNNDVIETLTYAIREIIRNSFEHSTARSIWLVGQYWQSYDAVEISILDQGIGVLDSLRLNPKLQIYDHENALHLAILPGVSGKLVGNKRRKGLANDTWANSGYGLYVTSRLCQKGGRFSIVSGNRALSMHEGGVNFYNCQFNGTALRLVLKVSAIDKLSGTLKQIISEGRAIAKKTLPSANITASMITSMLSDWGR
jgi:hypothetical protein